MANDVAIEKQESQAVPAERTRGGAYRPNVDIIEKSDELLLLADIPGAAPEDIDISFERGVLSVDARVNRRAENRRGTYDVHEYGVGDYARSFQVGEGINADAIHAEFGNGVLTLHLPKTEDVMPKRISVKPV